MNTEYIPNVELYNRWAETYDTDGNVLQQLDDFAFTKLVYPALQPSVKRILDLGCGTGRNTVKLLQRGISIIAIDASTAMMNEARIRVAQVPATKLAIGSVQWLLWDIESGQAPLPEMLGVDAVVSTLVLEHVRLENFFKVIRACLKPGGFAFVTNMHPDLGSRSAAGFVGRNGQKVRGVSYNYGVEETIEAAAGVGLILREEVDVSGVEGEDDVKRFGARARKWVGLKLCVAFLFELRKTDLC